MIYELVETSGFGKGATIVPIVLAINSNFGEPAWEGTMFEAYFCLNQDSQD